MFLVWHSFHATPTAPTSGDQRDNRIRLIYTIGRVKRHILCIYFYTLTFSQGPGYRSLVFGYIEASRKREMSVH